MKSWLLILSLLLLILLSIVTLVWGQSPWEIVWNGVLKRVQGHTSQWNPLLDERLPRLLVLLCTGASLAVSGSIMQSLFQNPLATQNVLGIVSGSCLCVVLIFWAEWHQAYPWSVPLSAVLGALLTLLMVYSLSKAQTGSYMVQHILLTGLAVSTVLISLQSVITYVLRDHWQLIQTLTEWEAGSTLDRSWRHVHMQLPLFIIGLFFAFRYRSEINMLSLGEEEAANLGVDVSKVRWRLFLCVSLLTGGAIAAVGNIAFFGLVLPHMLRQKFGPNQMTLMPLCTLLGGIILLAMDLTLRIFSITMLSIGNICAVIGGLFFLLMLFKHKEKI